MGKKLTVFFLTLVVLGVFGQFYVFLKSSMGAVKMLLAKGKVNTTKPEVGRLNGINDELKVEIKHLTENLEKKARRMLQFDRHAKLRTFCQRHYSKKAVKHIVNQNFLYDAKHNFMYNSVPKTGCTNWKRVMLVLKGQFKSIAELKDKDKVHDYGLPKLRELKGNEHDRVKNTFYSFFFVRDPFERILASYRNKLLDVYTSGFQRRVGQNILRLYRNNLTEEVYKEGKNVTFKEFIDFIIHKNETIGLHGLDEHWQLMHRLTSSCSIKYDYIGKMETLIEDAEQILSDLNLTDKIKFPVNLTDKYKKKTKRLMMEYYSKLPKETLGRLYEIYKDDYDAFGYKKPEFL